LISTKSSKNDPPLQGARFFQSSAKCSGLIVRRSVIRSECFSDGRDKSEHLLMVLRPCERLSRRVQNSGQCRNKVSRKTLSLPDMN
jgi:hypothetical protein